MLTWSYLLCKCSTQQADKQYKKRALGNFYKSSPTGGSSQAKGIVLEKVGVEAKQVSSVIFPAAFLEYRSRC